jgi:ABC-type multidrug transport system fused ATPase/permease subunit
VALGAKTGQSRCLIDAAEREWKMSLPDPVPLSLLEGCSCLQLRNATVGFANPTATTGAEGQEKSAAAVTAPAAMQSGSKAPTPAAGPSSSLGSKKVRAVAAPVAATPKVECTMVVENVTLDAHQKSKIAILGKNGCGKRYVSICFYHH